MLSREQDLPADRLHWHWKPQGRVPQLHALGSWDDLLAWLRRHAQCVKQGVHRLVFRYQGAQGTVYVKLYRTLGLGRRMLHLVRRCAACREFRAAEAVSQRGVPVVEVLGWAECSRRGLPWGSVLVTAEVPQARSLAQAAQQLEALPPRRRTQCLKRFLARLAQLCAQMHDQGILQKDLHAENILVHGPLDDPQMILIDLPSVRVSRPLGAGSSQHNLGSLAATLWRFRRLGRWHVFWIQYLRHRKALPWKPPARQAALRTLELAIRRIHRVAGRRDKRALRNNKDFCWIHDRRGHFGFCTAVPPQQRQQLIGQACGPKVLGSAEAGPWRWWGRVRTLGTFGLLWTWEPVVHTWVLAHALDARGIAVLLPQAVLLPRGTNWAWLVFPLAEWQARTPWPEEPQAVHLPERLARAWGELLGRLHFAHFSAASLDWGEVLWDRKNHCLVLPPRALLGLAATRKVPEQRECQQVLWLLAQRIGTLGSWQEEFWRAYRWHRFDLSQWFPNTARSSY